MRRTARTNPIKKSPRPSGPEHILAAQYVAPSKLYLRFGDGLEGEWSFAQLGIDMSNMKKTTIKAARSGAFVAVKSKWGDSVKLDASSFRVLVDPEYAAEIEKKLNALATKIGL